MPDIGNPISHYQSDYLYLQVQLQLLLPTHWIILKQLFNIDLKVLDFVDKDLSVNIYIYSAYTLGYNPAKILKEMHARGGGLLQFYEGFQSAFIGRISYLVLRNSLYKIIYDVYKPTKPFNDLTIR
jgi:hypothetical protein